NMGVTVGLFPVTGQPLPWISRGGTSILVTSLAFGIILGVSRSVEKKQDEAAV
ncbi:MAG: FtsW/RodA/SpoVE family cell cycle protein, partial [Bacteroidales bacterium]|nr:FtsW/RodA/SpoVE family cell cycle protein [Bacteroidales bacterium]